MKSKHSLILAGLFLVSALLQFGCASTHKTTRTDTAVTYSSEAPVQDNAPVVEKSQTTTTTTDTKTEHPGVVGSTLHAVGYVLVLPFIIVGGLFRILFGG
jgi:hypothetical protein